MRLNINTDKVVAFTNKLEKMSKSAFPVAVRSTLNDTAFDVKTKSMPASSASTFEQRQPNFFKANSKFIPAQGFNINTMESNVGFFENKLKNASTNWAVKDLQQQESGGTINKKSFIPLVNARTGKNFKGTVKPNARLSKIKKIVDSRKVPALNARQAFRKAVALAGKGGFVLGNKEPGILWQVYSLNRNSDGSFKMGALYSFKKARSVKVNQTHFMQEASQVSANRMDNFYINQALRQFRKAGIIR